jgi:hypothetical protein
MEWIERKGMVLLHLGDAKKRMEQRGHQRERAERLQRRHWRPQSSGLAAAAQRTAGIAPLPPDPSPSWGTDRGRGRGRTGPPWWQRVATGRAPPPRPIRLAAPPCGERGKEKGGRE